MGGTHNDPYPVYFVLSNAHVPSPAVGIHHSQIPGPFSVLLCSVAYTGNGPGTRLKLVLCEIVNDVFTHMTVTPDLEVVWSGRHTQCVDPKASRCTNC